MSQTLLLLGATSEIGRETALTHAREGWTVLVAGRDLEGARRTAEDVAIRTGAAVSALALDILKTGDFESFIAALPALPERVVCVIGEMGEQARAQSDADYAAQVLRTNFEGPALLLGMFAEKFAARGFGIIVGVGSVAGDRGRGANYVYGSAKAGMAAFLSGLRSRLARTDVRVITVKPGYVRTRMTAGRRLPPILTADAEEVGRAIFAAAEKGGRDVVYVRAIWRFLMLAIVLLPEPLFKKLTF